MAVLEISDLHVTVEAEGAPREILTGVDLTIRSGETHAIMGPNGSGKSTLAYALAGHPKYTVTSGAITLDGEDVLAMTVDERARAGVFLAMQYPVEVPGVSVSNFLRTAATAVRGEAPKLRTWVKEVNSEMDALDIDALRVVSDGVNRVRETGVGTLLITHYTRILRYVKPDFVHVFVGGKIVEQGGSELAEKLEVSGYEEWEGREAA